MITRELDDHEELARIIREKVNDLNRTVEIASRSGVHVTYQRAVMHTLGHKDYEVLEVHIYKEL